MRHRRQHNPLKVIATACLFIAAVCARLVYLVESEQRLHTESRTVKEYLDLVLPELELDLEDGKVDQEAIQAFHGKQRVRSRYQLLDENEPTNNANQLAEHLSTLLGFRYSKNYEIADYIETMQFRDVDSVYRATTDQLLRYYATLYIDERRSPQYIYDHLLAVRNLYDVLEYRGIRKNNPLRPTYSYTIWFLEDSGQVELRDDYDHLEYDRPVRQFRAEFVRDRRIQDNITEVEDYFTNHNPSVDGLGEPHGAGHKSDLVSLALRQQQARQAITKKHLTLRAVMAGLDAEKRYLSTDETDRQVILQIHPRMTAELMIQLGKTKAFDPKTFPYGGPATSPAFVTKLLTVQLEYPEATRHLRDVMEALDITTLKALYELPENRVFDYERYLRTKRREPPDRISLRLYGLMQFFQYLKTLEIRSSNPVILAYQRPDSVLPKLYADTRFSPAALRLLTPIRRREGE